MNLDNKKIKTKLMYAFSILFIIPIVIGIMFFIYVGQNSSNDTKLRERTASTTAIQENLNQYLEIRVSLLRTMFSKTQTDREKFANESEGKIDTFDSLLKAYSQLNLSDQEKSKLENIQKNWETYSGEVKSTMRNDSLFVKRLGPLSQIGNSIVSDIKEIKELNKSASQEIEEQNKSSEKLFIILFIIVFVVGILLAYYLATSFGNKISKPIIHLQKFAEEVSSGNLNYQDEFLEEYSNNLDEAGNIIKFLQDLVKKLLKSSEESRKKSFWYEQILDNIPFPISVTDINMNWTFVNKAVRDMFKKDLNFFVGKPCNGWGASICKTKKCGVECLRRGETETFFEQDGKSYKVVSAYLKDENGKTLGHIEVVIDITKDEEYKRYLENFVKEMQIGLNSFADGNLNTEIKIHEKDTDAAKSIKSSFNSMTKIMKKIIEEIVQISTSVASAMNQMSASIEQISAASVEQSSQANMVSSSAQEVSSTMEENTNLIKQTSDAAQETLKIINNTQTLLQKTTGEITKISNNTQSATKLSSELTVASKEVEKIVKLISDIADQTNMLALNATIEAASAGEAGKGFAVVANEVKELAKQTAESTLRISEEINTIQTVITNITHAIAEMAKSVEETEEHATKTTNEFGNIITNSEKTIKASTSSLQTIKEQVSAVNDISRNILGVSQGANETSGAINEINRALEEINKQTQILNNLVSKFKF